MPLTTRAKVSRPEAPPTPLDIPRPSQPIPAPSTTTTQLGKGSLYEALGLAKGALPDTMRMGIPSLAGVLGGPVVGGAASLAAEPLARMMEGRSAFPGMAELSTPEGQAELFNSMVSIVHVPHGPFLPGSAVAKEGKLTRVLHGTGADFAKFDLERTGDGAGGELYGPGIYFTEGRHKEATGGRAIQDALKELEPTMTPEQLTKWKLLNGVEVDPVTEGYARVSSPRPQYLQELQDDKKHLEGILQGLKSGTQTLAPGNTLEQFEQDLADVNTRLDQAANLKVGPNVRPHYLDIQKPFDMEQEFDVYGVYDPNDPEDIVGHFGTKLSELGYDVDSFMERASQRADSGNVLGSDIYRIMASVENEDGRKLGKEKANQLLQSMGYDGITHIGGQGRMSKDGAQTHRVWIAFSPDQVHDAFPLEHQARMRELQTDIPKK